MAGRPRWVGCHEEFSRVNRDIDWTLRTVRHVNRKLENLKGEWRTWTSQAEERAVKEWYAQTDINNKLRAENATQQRIIEAQQRQIDHLYLLINEVYGNLERQKSNCRGGENSSQFPAAAKEAEHQA